MKILNILHTSLSPRIKKNLFFMVMAFENVKQIGNGTNVLDFIINYTSYKTNI